MPNTPPRTLDHILIADNAANKEAIANIKEDVHDLSEKLEAHADKVDEKFNKADDALKAIDKKIDTVIAGFAAQSNQIIGASKLTIFLWRVFPYLCGGVGIVSTWYVAIRYGK